MKGFKYSLVASVLAGSSLCSEAATYQVVEIATDNQSRHNYGLAINNSGHTLSNATDFFNYPINIERLNISLVEAELLSAQALNPDTYPDVTIEDIKNGELNAQAIAFLKTHLTGNWSNRNVQKYGNRVAFITDDEGHRELTFFDEEQEGFNGKTRSTLDIAYAINDLGHVVGAGTDVYRFSDYFPAPTEEEPEPETLTFWRKSFVDRMGVVIQGEQKVSIPSEFQLYGGSSILNDISNSGYVVGYAAVNISLDASLGLEAVCPDEEDEDRLLQCAWQVQNDMLARNANQEFYRYRAFRWQLDDNAQVIETRGLGLLFESDNSESSSYFSAATGVNELGYMSGFSSGYSEHPDNSGSIRTMATFHDGENYVSIVDQDEYFSSRAYDINDNNIVVGYATRVVNSTSTNQLFYYDHNNNQTIYPEGFFSSSAWEGKAINNQNQIVGYAEIQTDRISNRRTVGFLYEVDSQTMTDLNQLIACDSPYQIVEANDINDNGEIAGTALISIPQKDDLGNAMLDDNGQALIEQVARGVKLIPIQGGTVEDCGIDESVIYERKGAIFSPFSMLFLGILFGIARLVRPVKHEI